MKQKIFLSIILSFFLAISYQAKTQFTPSEIAQRQELEEFLRTAKIIAHTQMWGREAVTHPFRVTLKKDDMTRDALLKTIDGRLGGYWECWKFEIAAYYLDKYLRLNMVPPTVEKTFQGKPGSCQLWVDYEISLRNKIKNKIATPSYKVFHWNRATYLQRAFDNLIANEDRHAGNILITKDWRMILIDHSHSFRTSKKFIKNLIYTEKHKEGPKLMKELPRAFVEKIKALDFELMREIVGEYLTKDEINAVLARKELMLSEIDKLISKHGEEKALY